MPARTRNLITDVEGLRVGNSEDLMVLTGTTVIMPDRPVVMAVDIRGGAPGSRETPALEPETLVDGVHGLVLSGGSVFGLDAASAVASALARRGKGFNFGEQVWPCPVVPSAILFDLMNGGNKAWKEPPYHRLGVAAFENAAFNFKLGNAGAGTGALAGALKGGLGSASATWGHLTVGALTAVNSVGSCVDPATGNLWARAYARGNEMGPVLNQPLPELARTKLDVMAEAAKPGASTTIAAVATDARLAKAEAKRLAIMAADGLAIAIRPLHTPFDGDTVFAIATGSHELDEPRAVSLARLGALAAETLARAVGRAIWEAETAGKARSYRDLTARQGNA